MSLEDGRFSEIYNLLEALCEDRMMPEQLTRLEELVLNDREARQLYLQYVDLHGTLYWDIATGVGDEVDLSVSAASARFAAGLVPPQPVETDPADSLATGRGTAAVKRAQPASRIFRTGVFRNRRIAVMAVVSACALVIVGLIVQWTFAPNHESEGIAKSFPVSTSPDTVLDASRGNELGARKQEQEPTTAPLVNNPRPPEQAPPNLNIEHPDAGGANVASQSNSPDTPEKFSENNETLEAGSSTPEVIAYVDGQIQLGWDNLQIEPSPVADDAEWVRRVYLDILGHIPPADEADDFLRDHNPQKRSLLVENLLDDPVYVRNWTTIWTNLLIGSSASRDAKRGVDRPSLQQFLRVSFKENRPWSEIVFDLVAAEGRDDQSGAANFLLAHLNNEAVPATAITARLFLGTQVQCTQCHDHPFNNWKQYQFWELNSFFQQTKKRSHSNGAELVSHDVGGPTFFETRSGVMRVAFPKFAGTKVDPGPQTNRRRELAKLMTNGENPLIARAIVNRMWGHFFGFAFTRPVDDMGPHNPPTHPELFNRLSREFVANGYDLKRLIRWICNSEAYQLTSRFGEANEIDNPSTGVPPSFSRVYLKSMTAEQLYDSLLIATRAHQARRSNWRDVEQTRQQWLQQFVIAFQTEENDEATTFDGTIPQALLMMNSELVQGAVSAERGTSLHEVIAQRSSNVEKIKQLYLSALSRHPTSTEIAAAKKLLRQRSPRHKPQRRLTLTETLQDLFWALLNSNEFILIH